MVKCVQDSKPNVIQVDTTFNVDNANYKLAAMVYLCPKTNKTEIAALAFTSNETAENFNFIFNKFKEMYSA